MSTLPLNELVNFCNTQLAIDQFKDYAPNGLQVQGKANISTIVTGVTASKALIEAAIVQHADAIIVHHGYFWKGEPEPLTGMKGARIKLLMQHDISLLAYHLPLDAHPTLGNNAALADLFQFTVDGALDPFEKNPIGNIGTCQTMSVADFITHLTITLNRPPLHLPGQSSHIARVGWCSGAAQDFIGKAAAAGCDAYISGEVSERTAHEAAELGIHYFGCGHHATETGGIKRLTAAITTQFGIDARFIHIENPI